MYMYLMFSLNFGSTMHYLIILSVGFFVYFVVGRGDIYILKFNFIFIKYFNTLGGYHE